MIKKETASLRRTEERFNRDFDGSIGNTRAINFGEAAFLDLRYLAATWQLPGQEDPSAVSRRWEGRQTCMVMHLSVH